MQVQFRVQKTGVPAAFVGLFALAAIGSAAPALAASLTRSVDVDAAPDRVWQVIGPFCAIRDWHPAIGTCTLDGHSPPTRTLVTKDGAATFVEPQVARSEAARQYSYSFKSSPFPVQRYIGTIRVVARSGGGSTVIWHGDYTPDSGKDHEANDDFAAVYEAGLAALKARFGG